MLFSSANDQLPDKQGRINVPADLRAYAGLDGDIVVAGNGSTCELWAPEAWQHYLQEQERSFAGLDEEVIPGLLR